MTRLLVTFLILTNVFFSFAQEAEEEMDSATVAQYLAYYLDAIEKDSLLNYQYAEIEIGDGIANLMLDSAFKYLDPAESSKILVDAWGNPPQETLGMIFPDSVNPYLYDGWGIIIGYLEDGYIEDEDAKDIDYDEMLEDLQAEAEEVAVERRELGYPGYDVVGWAEQPYYDENSKKLYWAKELKFDETDENTLNYEIRVLGRKGYLEFNAIAGITQLDEVKIGMQDLLPRVEFSEGNTYFDFDPDTDQVAAYGIGALVAGKLAAKAGILKVIGVFLLKFWKFILLGFAGAAGLVKKIWFGGGKEKREIA